VKGRGPGPLDDGVIINLIDFNVNKNNDKW